jgi:hypothetical protein
MFSPTTSGRPAGWERTCRLFLAHPHDVSPVSILGASAKALRPAPRIPGKFKRSEQQMPAPNGAPFAAAEDKRGKGTALALQSLVAIVCALVCGVALLEGDSPMRPNLLPTGLLLTLSAPVVAQTFALSGGSTLASQRG